jgi:catechol 2,3-dioxygenase-like lactoylglutathione lyase family enzyme
LIVTPGSTERTGSPFGPHIGFEVEDFDATRHRLERAGIDFVLAPNPAGARQQLWLSDPDGNTLELTAE